MTLSVARIKPSEWFNSTLIVLAATALEILAFPVALGGWLAQKLSRIFRRNSTSFTQQGMALDAVLTQKPVALDRIQPTSISEKDLMLNRRVVSAPQTLETQTLFILTLGSQEIVAHIDVDIQPSSKGLFYALKLTYKQQRFETAYFPLLEEAFIALSDTLSQYQIQPKTCGTCAYWFVDEQSGTLVEGLPKQGTCLKDKQGQALSTQDLALNVLSLPCEAHTERSQHERIVQAWKQSMVNALEEASNTV